MGGVVVTTPYLTVHLVSVILTEINRVVIITVENVVTLGELAIVYLTVQITSFSKTGGNQMGH